MVVLTKSMEIGVPEVDAQHQELADRLNTVISMGTKAVSQEETQKTLDFLGEYIDKHFRDEEALQKESGYPKYEWHKGHHQFFVGEFLKLKQEFADKGASPQFTVEINNSIITWIVTHIKSVDAEFGRYYQAHVRGEQPNPPDMRCFFSDSPVFEAADRNF